MITLSPSISQLCPPAPYVITILTGALLGYNNYGSTIFGTPVVNINMAGHWSQNSSIMFPLCLYSTGQII